jgi:RecB family exonuclease
VGIEDFARELDGRTVGNLLHGALSRVFRQLAAEERTPLRPEDVARAVSLGCAAVHELAQGADCPGTPGERRIASWKVKELLRAVLLMEASSRSRLATLGTEVWVGEHGGVDIGGLRVRGRVDRVDADPAGGGVFVVDYKSGKVPSLSRIGTEEALQLPLYLLALGAEHGERPLLGGVYLSASDRKRAGFVLADQAEILGLPADAAKAFRRLSPQEAEELYASARALAVRATEGMRSGAIAPLPDRSCPSWCELRAACRAYRGRAGS